jgi:hypothetical protein
MKRKLFSLLVLLMTTMSLCAMQIYVHLPTGSTITLEVEASDSFENLKAKIEDKTGIDHSQQILTYNNQVLADDKTLSEYGITSSGKTLELSLANYYLTAGTTEHGAITFKVNDNVVTMANENDEVTMTITPAVGWAVNAQGVSATTFTTWGSTRGSATTIPFLGDVELTQSTTNTWTFTMPAASVEVSATYKKLLTHTDISITVADATYTGSALTPTVTVKDGETMLVENTDYTVVYSNNTAAALFTAAENAPTVTISAVANHEQYVGSATKTFTITPKEVTLTWTTSSLVYSGSAQAPEAIVGSLVGADECIVTDYTGKETNVGTDYIVTATTLSNSNYKLPTPATHTYSITKATPVISENPTAGAITYGETLANSTLTGGSATFNSQTVTGSLHGLLRPQHLPSLIAKARSME